MAKITKEDIIDDIQTDFAYDIIGDMNPFKKGKNVKSISPPNLISDIQKRTKHLQLQTRKEVKCFQYLVIVFPMQFVKYQNEVIIKVTLLKSLLNLLEINQQGYTNG